jgi:S1-C subfamily serine protease
MQNSNGNDNTYLECNDNLDRSSFIQRRHAGKRKDWLKVAIVVSLFSSVLSLGLTGFAILEAPETTGGAMTRRTFSQTFDYHTQPAYLDELIATATESVVRVFCDGSGSGFALNAKPESPRSKTVIVTNYHVIEQCRDEPELIEVLTPTSDTGPISVRLRGYDADTDLALLEIDATLPPLRLSTQTPERGWWTMAIGNPIDRLARKGAMWPTLINATSFGSIVYVLGESWVYTSATLNHGFSGGPLLDSQGEVIGINTLGSSNDEEGVWNIAVNPAMLCRQLVECD